MFWKKKTKDKDTSNKLFKNPTATRGAFRVYPSKEKPILLKIGSTPLSALDISASGVSFSNKDFKLGEKYSMELTLPNDQTMELETEILKIDEKNICRCKIMGLNPEQEDAIHYYILARQKEELAEKQQKY
ncbi:PilZ domain-containing protein [Nitrospinaceae bacterium]|nr:PilZ domain-containing protein [Nitrospinaceae bacterium]